MNFLAPLKRLANSEAFFADLASLVAEISLCLMALRLSESEDLLVYSVTMGFLVLAKATLRTSEWLRTQKKQSILNAVSFVSAFINTGFSVYFCTSCPHSENRFEFILVILFINLLRSFSESRKQTHQNQKGLIEAFLHGFVGFSASGWAFFFFVFSFTDIVLIFLMAFLALSVCFFFLISSYRKPRPKSKEFFHDGGQFPMGEAPDLGIHAKQPSDDTIVQHVDASCRFLTETGKANVENLPSIKVVQNGMSSEFKNQISIFNPESNQIKSSMNFQSNEGARSFSDLNIPVEHPKEEEKSENRFKKMMTMNEYPKLFSGGSLQSSIGTFIRKSMRQAELNQINEVEQENWTWSQGENELFNSSSRSGITMRSVKKRQMRLWEYLPSIFAEGVGIFETGGSLVLFNPSFLLFLKWRKLDTTQDTSKVNFDEVQKNWRSYLTNMKVKPVISNRGNKEQGPFMEDESKNFLDELDAIMGIPYERMLSFEAHATFIFKDKRKEFSKLTTRKSTKGVNGDQAPNLPKSKVFEVSVYRRSFLEGKSVMTMIKITEITRQVKYFTVKSSNKFRNFLISSLAHEVRTPLNHLMTSIKMLKYDNSPESIFNSLSALKLFYLVFHGIMNLGLAQAETLTCKPQPVSLEKIISKMVELKRPLFENRGIELNFRRQSQKETIIVHDKVFLKIIIFHFLSNAIKYTSKGSVEIFINQREATSEVELVFQDTGIGMKTKVKKNLSSFIKNFNTTSAPDEKISKNSTGANLGFMICLTLLQYMHPWDSEDCEPRIRFESKVGMGSIFYVRILTEHNSVKGTVTGNEAGKNLQGFKLVKSSNESEKTLLGRHIDLGLGNMGAGVNRVSRHALMGISQSNIGAQKKPGSQSNEKISKSSNLNPFQAAHDADGPSSSLSLDNPFAGSPGPNKHPMFELGEVNPPSSADCVGNMEEDFSWEEIDESGGAYHMAPKYNLTTQSITKKMESLKYEKKPSRKCQKCPRRVLIVDDEEFNLTAFKAVFKMLCNKIPEAKFEVSMARDGSEGVKVFQELFDTAPVEKDCEGVPVCPPVSLVIVDHNMPKMEGPDAICEMIEHVQDRLKTGTKEEREKAPLFFGFTSYAGKEYEQQFLKAGANGMLKKPLCVGELAKLMKSL